MNHYLSTADSDFPEWFMHLEMLTNRLKMFVKAEKFNVLFFSFFFVCVYVFFFIYLMSSVSDLTCLST